MSRSAVGPAGGGGARHAAEDVGAEAEQFALAEAERLALLARDAGEELRAGFAEVHPAVDVGGAIEAGALERDELAEEREDAGARVGRRVAETADGLLDLVGPAPELLRAAVDGAHARPVLVLRERHLGAGGGLRGGGCLRRGAAGAHR